MPIDHFARAVRVRRLHRRHPQRLFFVPLDHSISDGPLIRRGSLDPLIESLAGTGVDAVILHKGPLRYIRPERFTGLSLIVHLSASTMHAPDPDAKYLVTGVEEAVRLGADAVSVHVNLGSADERRQIADLGAVGAACDRWNVPLLAMMYPRGPKIADPRAPELVMHAATIAVDLGADIVKTPYPGTTPEMADVTRAVPIPLIVAGGPAAGNEDKALTMIRDALDGGAAGTALGRTVFQSADPGAVARKVSALVHSPAPAVSGPARNR
ncbi:2-amino-3,7-dideoxy-D-threo-hept-6-ulosonate synthase [Amycolatopsis jejuensis]|uniref:2-amino-3,7-dideoxy-D-threo-hept-6-ulosonate synthase n=1 Tax=Amycolatopsis jejuensis TaxID=330084 RepID=UPI000526265A|nr:2-amino-3,7-dideoxy-D-threo-hept-6-ulosonate synthase [Amycolatopsis jejuensis]